MKLGFFLLPALAACLLLPRTASAQALHLTGSIKSASAGVFPFELHTTGVPGRDSLIHARCSSPVFKQGKKPVEFQSFSAVIPDQSDGTVFRIGEARATPSLSLVVAGSTIIQRTATGSIRTSTTDLSLYRQGSGEEVYYAGTFEISSKTHRRMVAPFGEIPADSLKFNVVLYPPRKQKPQPEQRQAIPVLPKPALPKPRPALPLAVQPAPQPQMQQPKPFPFDTAGYTPLYWWNGEDLKLDLWDNYDEDGDAVRVQWNNGATATCQLKRAKATSPFTVLPLQINTLTFTIASEGNVPGNTASVAIYGGDNKPIYLSVTGKLGQVFKLYFARRP